MTHPPRWFTVPALSIGALGIAFSAGIFVDHTTVAQAQFVPRSEYTKDQNALQVRQLSDSLTLELTKQLIFARLEQQSTEQARANRVLYRVACHLYPTECDR